MIARKTLTIPGFDHVHTPCNADKSYCGHGCHSDEWIYIVSEGPAALVLTVFSNIYPPSVTTMEPREPKGADLTLHLGYPVTEEHVREGGNGRECEWVEGNRCWVAYSRCIVADDILKKFGLPDVDQPEGFWVELERQFVELRSSADAERTDQCPTCKGSGTVAR